MRRIAGLVLVAVVALGACSTDERALLPGDYAGSTASDQAVRITIGDKPKVNDKKATWEDTGVLKSEALGLVKCVMAADGEELSCRIGAETVELVRV